MCFYRVPVARVMLDGHCRLTPVTSSPSSYVEILAPTMMLLGAGPLGGDEIVGEWSPCESD